MQGNLQRWWTLFVLALFYKRYLALQTNGQCMEPTLFTTCVSAFKKGNTYTAFKNLFLLTGVRLKNDLASYAISLPMVK